ncbi:hypothetical protein [Enterococcus faecalis]|uniref:hypothetical protein n=1 Tax=Enterococcus faecalis TaxID=1351 RepID=UPI001C8F48E6|nr:hypothetical protein [Enterococcus faecalis]
MNKSINISNIPKRDVAIKANHIVYINCQPSVANISIKTKIRDIIDVKKNKKESNIILSNTFTSVFKFLKRGDFSAITGIKDTVKKEMLSPEMQMIVQHLQHG